MLAASWGLDQIHLKPFETHSLATSEMHLAAPPNFQVAEHLQDQLLETTKMFDTSSGLCLTTTASAH